MAKLDEIPKKDFFTTPEDYFERLPGRIHSRIEKKQNSSVAPALQLALKYALPLLLIGAVLFFYPSDSREVENMLASVETQALIEYLHESGITSEDLIETVEFSAQDLQAIEDEIYEGSMFEIDSANIDL